MKRKLKANPIKDARSKSKPNKRKKRIYCSFLTFVLLVCLFQIGRSATISVAKVVDLNYKVNKLNKINKEAKNTNHKLKQELEVYSSLKGAEEVARNTLKLTGKNEILVIIKD